MLRLLALPGGKDAPADAELILAAYARWGEDCPRHLVGDFAFALWDVPRRRLFCARDPLGIRPFFYHLTQDRLVVASSLDALVSALETPPAVNEAFLRDLLAWRFERWLEETPYTGVLRLPPAHQMSVQDGRSAIRRYWILGNQPPSNFRRDEEYVEQFREILLEAVRARLRVSSGPVGLLVSGGLDSSSLACAAEHLVATAQVSREIRLYSSVFRSTPGAEEQEFAEAVAQRCRHGSMTYLLCDDCWGLREFGDEQGRWLAEPEIGTSRGLMLRPMRQARADGCRVVLSGIGGDQVLGGEPYHRPVLLRDIGARRWGRELKHFRRYSRKGTARLFVDAWLRPSISQGARSFLRSLRRDGSFPARRQEVRNPLPPPELPDRSAAVAYGSISSGGFSARLSYQHRAAANVGVEHRLPYLDRRLVDFLLGLPAQLRFRDGLIKWVLRRAFAGDLPAEVRDRTSVAYFSGLEERGLRWEERRRIDALLAGSRVVEAGWMPGDLLRRTWEGYRSGEEKMAPRSLIGFLCVESWLRSRESLRSPRQGASEKPSQFAAIS